MTAADVVGRLRERFGAAILSDAEFRGEHAVSVDLSSLKEICRFCRDELAFDYLVDITSLDHYGEDPRFEMVYELYAMGNGLHLRLKSLLPGEDNPLAPTVSDLWPTADWHEREAYDMMGIRFEGHPDLRRILMWEGYPFYPLRKDFPLEGKASEMPDVAFSGVAPLAGGPFVTVPADATTQVREPRARRAGDEIPRDKFTAEP